MKLKEFEEYNVDLSTVEGTERFMRCLFDTIREAKAEHYPHFKNCIRSLLKIYGDERAKAQEFAGIELVERKFKKELKWCKKNSLRTAIEFRKAIQAAKKEAKK